MKKKAFSIAFLIAIGMTQVYASNDDRNMGKKDHPVIHNILSDKLPAKLLTTIRKDYKSYWITDLYKSNVNGKISYHITIENPDQVMHLSANQPGSWTVKSVVAKDQELAAK